MLVCQYVSRQRIRIKESTSAICVVSLRSLHTNRSCRNTPLAPSTTNQRVRPSSLHSTRRRHYTTPRDVEHVGILGGGITGLACAYYLSQDQPNVKITLFERNKELGGWVRSTRNETDDGEILWEQGPRSLRTQAPNGSLALRLVQELGLMQSLRWVDKLSPAARNRFLYYPDHLVLMPGPGRFWSNLRTFLTEPAFSGTISGFFREIYADKRSDSLADESIGSFLTRRFGDKIANNIASALVHGIYAGDVHQLSFKSIFPLLWANEVKHGSVVEGFFQQAFRKDSWGFCDDIELQLTLQKTKWDPIWKTTVPRMSVFYFEEGMASLYQALEKKLIASPNVQIMTSTNVHGIVQSEGNRLSLEYSQDSSEHGTVNLSHVVSTLSSPELVRITNAASKQEGANISAISAHKDLQNSIGKTHAVTVGVVNLYYQEQDLLRKVRPPNGLPPAISRDGLSGFGYLIPNSVPLDQNPEFALGVIFDSDVTPEHGTSVPPEKLGTRLTVMLGGHYWDGWGEYPEGESLKEMAMSVLSRHLGIVQLPLASKATVQHQCIPQYVVGHHERMSTAHDALLSMYDGRVRVAGSWYTGVGINDCLRSAWDVVKGLQPGPAAGQRRSHERTGLEAFSWGRPMALTRRSAPGVIDVVEVEPAGLQRGYLQEVIREAEEERMAKENRDEK